jgi:hypothetical protein
MTALTSAEIEDYYQRVRDCLGDLEVTVRDDLLEDLPDHLAEVAAEGTGSLIERLGTPEDYAAELRTAAGLAGPSEVRIGRSWAERGRRLAELLDRADVRLARPLGYARLSELLAALRPGWWVLRGWLAAQLLCGTHDGDSWHGFVPRLNNSPVLGFVMLIAVVAASIWLGRRSPDWTVWPRRLVAAAGVLLAGWGVLVLTNAVGGTTSYDYSYAPTGDSGNYSPLNAVTDVYGYDSNGNPVPGLRLFDQAGNPIQLGSPACQDGSQAPGAAEQSWTYPLCPTDPGPFRAGPGALPAPSGHTSGAVGSSDSAQPSGAARSSGATRSSGSASPTQPASGSRPVATPTRSR